MDKDIARQALGIRIRSLRKEQHITLRRFALMVGLSKDYLVDVEYGRKSPTLDTIVKISAGLDVTPAELLQGIGEPIDKHREPVGQAARRYQASKL